MADITLSLTEAQVTLLRLPRGRTVGTTDIGDLQGGALMRRRYAVGKRFNGLITSRDRSMVTCA